MVHSDAATVDEYIAGLPPDRREAVSAIRDVILQHLPAGYEEGMQFGMIGYYVPFSRLAKTYNGQPLGYAALASQKNYISVYLTCIYADPEGEAWFRAEYAKTGRKPNMGKSCVRFRKIEDVPLDLIAQAIAREPVDDFIAHYRAVRG